MDEVRITKLRHSSHYIFTILKSRPYDFLSPSLRMVYIARRADMFYREIKESGLGGGKSVSPIQRWYCKAYKQVRLHNDIESHRVETNVG